MFKFVLGFIAGRVGRMPKTERIMEIEDWEQIAYEKLSENGIVPHIDCDIYDHPQYELISQTAEYLSENQ